MRCQQRGRVHSALQAKRNLNSFRSPWDFIPVLRTSIGCGHVDPDLTVGAISCRSFGPRCIVGYVDSDLTVGDYCLPVRCTSSGA